MPQVTRKDRAEAIAQNPATSLVLEQVLGLIDSGMTVSEVLNALPELADYTEARLTSDISNYVAQQLLRYATILANQETI